MAGREVAQVAQAVTTVLFPVSTAAMAASMAPSYSPSTPSSLPAVTGRSVAALRASRHRLQHPTTARALRPRGNRKPPSTRSHLATQERPLEPCPSTLSLCRQTRRRRSCAWDWCAVQQEIAFGCRASAWTRRRLAWRRLARRRLALRPSCWALFRNRLRNPVAGPHGAYRVCLHHTRQV